MFAKALHSAEDSAIYEYWVCILLFNLNSKHYSNIYKIDCFVNS